MSKALASSFLLILIWVVCAAFGGDPILEQRSEIAYTQFKRIVAEGLVSDVVLRGNRIEGTLNGPYELKERTPPVRRFRTMMPEFGDPEFLPILEKHGIELHVQEKESSGTYLLYWMPWLLMLAVYVWFLRRFYAGLPGGLGRSGAAGRFIRRGGAKKVEKIPDSRFQDVAGQDNAKSEVKELVDFLKDPEKYRRLGAQVPHGVLLMGPPGTGKTLLARALAGEAQVPFYSISASEFIELFVGVGAARVRDLFDEARKDAPSIIFIDELDSIGRVRGAGLGGGHDEREQTLNQILAELDGFSGHEAVVVLAATNRPDVLDPALLRPGRFDRHITLDLPDRNARLEILRVHVRNVPFEDDVDLDVIAGGTPGFSGADLKNLINEAAMMAAREGAAAVALRHFDEMRDRITMGTVRMIAMSPEEHHRLSIHEAGHATAAYFLPHADPLFKVSIIPRGRALGGTQQMPEMERYTLPETYLTDRLTVILAGRAAEKIALGMVSSGADDDIRQATKLARAMVTRWGMSEEVGPMDVRESEEHPFLGREIAQPRLTSDTTVHAVDQAIRRLLIQAEQRADEVIRSHRPAFDKLTIELETRETLDRAAIEVCLAASWEKHVKPMAV